MIKPFDMSDVGLLVEQAENSTFHGYMKQIAAEKQKAILENKAEEEEVGMEPEEGESETHEASETEEQEEAEGEEGETSDEDHEDTKEAVMNVVSLSKKDLEKLESEDPDLYEELEDFAKKICKYDEKEDKKED